MAVGTSKATQYIKEQGAPIVMSKRMNWLLGKESPIAITLNDVYEAVGSMLVNDVFRSVGCRCHR